MAEPAEMLQVKKRRLDESGGFVTGVEECSEEADAMLVEALCEWSRQEASQHNSVVWPLVQDLTVKVFSFLGTRWLSQVAASCKLFSEFARDPACYGDVDVAMDGALHSSNRVGNHTIRKLVQQAGQNLRSLRLGVIPLPRRTQCAVSNVDAGGSTQPLPVDPVPPNRVFRTCSVPQGRDFLSKTCLKPLTDNFGAAGALLTKLHLFNLEKMDSAYLCRALRACPRLEDLEVVGLCRNLQSVLECLGSNCPKLYRLWCQSKKSDRNPLGKRFETYREFTPVSSFEKLIKGCPDISQLALRGYGVGDIRANILFEGLLKLRVVDFSGARGLTGVFLRDIVGPVDRPSQLRTILLHDCTRLNEAEVRRFLFMIIVGECENLRHLDISSSCGLAARGWSGKQLGTSTEEVLLLVQRERTELCIVADFPDHKSRRESSESSEIDTSVDDSNNSGS